MLAQSITIPRLHQQQLIDAQFTTPEAVVSYFGAMQAQDYYGVLWSLGMRMQSATDSVIETAFNEGRLLRTHIMRPTWHLVLPEDIRWIMKLTSHRVNTVNTHMKRQLELDEMILARTNGIIGKALEGGNYLTRSEIGAELSKHAIDASGQRLAYIMFHAELELIACSGPRKGKQFTYALVDERAPKGKSIEGDEALAELVKRYLQGHAPASEADFAWWTGLTLTESRRAIELASSDLEQIVVDDETYYFLASMPPKTEACDQALLLPTFDEYYVGYTNFGEAVSGGRQAPKNLVTDSPIVINGRVIGTWKRTLKKNDVLLDVSLYEQLSDLQAAALDQVLAAYGEFLGLSTQTTKTLV